MIFMFMTGGVSHMDTFDPKPYLNKNHNKITGKGKRYYKGTDWAFRRHGKAGPEVSDLFPHIGSMMDDICVIRSMKNINGDHFGATIGIHTGSATFKRPSIGSWVSYGLGTDNANLPSFMVIAPGLPYAGGQVWGSDFLPVLHQGTRIIPVLSQSRTCIAVPPRLRCRRPNLACSSFSIANTLKGAKATRISGLGSSRSRPHTVAAEAPEAFDLTRETDATHRLYGLKRGDTEGFGWQCMVARRLASAVRFIELIDGDTRIDYNWDTHANMSNYNKLARNVDQPIAGLLKDLKSRGMLEDTLVVFATEFGRARTNRRPVSAAGGIMHGRLAVGLQVPGLKAAWFTAPAMRLVSMSPRISSLFMIFRRPSCTCLALITNGSPTGMPDETSV